MLWCLYSFHVGIVEGDAYIQERAMGKLFGLGTFSLLKSFSVLTFLWGGVRNASFWGYNLWVCIPSTCMSPLAALASRFIINVACFCAELFAFPLHLVWKKGDGGFGDDVSTLFGPCIVYALRFAAGAV